MKKSEVAELLARAAAFDKRTASAVEVEAWHEALGDLELGDCIEAVVRHHKRSSEYLMPVHIRDHVRVIVGERRDKAAASLGLERTSAPPPGRARRTVEQIKADLRARKTPPVEDVAS